MFEFLKNLDLFGAAVPGNNVRGESDIKTSTGACISIIVMALATMFALLKLEFMLLRDRPDVVSFIDDNFFDDSEVYNTAREDFGFAISAERYMAGLRIDPRYV